ncbi:hypothetical protein CACET_c15800 [Clostridium aceticum]|uniref:Uncharacterized protein n=1 Tax=Clostridium aceticum TaxID=84022 RepID=A0A0D8ID80_9CLOT|nr:HEPN domain-containing protein [Clostridium aceticum]AKL95029.1 hypothetical protein CACET_c15800 [Clostridium aceticum]KJF27922.1 hypothetical protein TZ02_04950 [Clostridium aceticum]
MKKFDLDENRFTRISGFLTVGYRDYLAARTLLINGLLYRGVIISATSIEKLLKVFIILNGSPKKTHKVDKLFDEAIEFDTNLSTHINRDFIDFLAKAYDLRYFDNEVFSKPSKRFKLSVAQYKTLAELDLTAITILNSFKVHYSGYELKSEYHSHLEEKYDLLYDKNFILNKTSKQSLIEQNQKVYQIKTVENGGVMERFYQTESAKNDGVFIFKDER